MKKIIFCSMLFLTHTAFAGVLETKAIKKGNDTIAIKVKAYEEKCGKTIAVNSHHADAAKTPLENRSADNMIATSASICASMVGHLTNLCNDTDYKAEVSKMTTLVCAPNTSLTKNPYMIVKKDGTTIKIEHNPITDGTSSAADAIKSIFN